MEEGSDRTPPDPEAPETKVFEANTMQRWSGGLQRMTGAS